MDVVCIPGMGDGIRAVKAGILEIAGISVANKSDMPGADDLIRQLEAMLRMHPASEEEYQPLIIGASALKNDGSALSGHLYLFLDKPAPFCNTLLHKK